MSCERVRPELTSYAREELAPDERAAIERHLASCAACAAELRKARRVRELFVGATGVTPSAASSARLMAAVDRELAAQALTAETASARERPRAVSARRFAILSVALHAAAAVFLAVAFGPVAGTGEDEPRPFSFVVRPPVDTAGGVEPGPLPDFQPATAGGARDVRGRAFPNAGTAKLLGRICDPEARTAALLANLGEDDRTAWAAANRGLEWLAAHQQGDGSFGDASETAWTVLANASAGRTAADDPSLSRAVAWLDRETGDDGAPGADVAAHAIGVRALTRQYAVDFGILPEPSRATGHDRLARAGRRLLRSQRSDGSFANGAEAAGETRGDVASTVAASAALADLRTTGVLDTSAALTAADAWLAQFRGPDGRVLSVPDDDASALGALLVEIESPLGRRRVDGDTAARLALRAANGRTAYAAALGVSALRTLERPIRLPVRGVTQAQREDGRWEDPLRGSVVATAAGVMALSRAAW